MPIQCRKPSSSQPIESPGLDQTSKLIAAVGLVLLSTAAFGCRPGADDGDDGTPANDASSVGDATVDGKSDLAEPRPRCRSAGSRRECLRRRSCQWSMGACRQLAPVFDSDRAVPLDVNVSGRVRPRLSVPADYSNWTFEASEAFSTHTDSSLAGYLRLSFDGPDGGDAAVVHRYRASADGNGRLDWEFSGGRCASGDAPWCDELADCGTSTSFPYTADGYWDGDRLAVEAPRLDGGGNGGCSQRATGGWVMVHDGFRPMTPDRPDVGSGPSPQSVPTFRGDAILRLAADEPLAVRACSLGLVYEEQDVDPRWKFGDFSCDGTAGDASVVPDSFAFTDDGRLWFVVERDEAPTRRLYVGVVGELDGTDRWRLTGRIADDDGQTYTGDASSPIEPSSIAAEDRIGTFTFHWTTP